jgi:transcriptional regulator with XRE-family HTH domain
MRLERGLTLREAADQIGISKTTLQRLEQAPTLRVQDLQARTAYRITSFYNLDLRQLASNCDQ